MQTNDGTEFTLRWHNHDAKLSQTLCKAWEQKQFLDVTLACGNQTIAAHKLVLCACSPLLESLLCSHSSAPAIHPHPMLYFNEIHYDDLVSLVEFMYKGYMTVTQHSLQGIMSAAQTLQVRGLCEGMNESVYSPPESSGSEPPSYPGQVKRKRRPDDEDDDDVQNDAVDDKDVETQSEEEVEKHVEIKRESSNDLSTEQQHQQQQIAALLSLAAFQQAAPMHSSKIYQQSQPAPSPSLRSRLVWDLAHIALLENWYNNETRYPSVAQSQMYASALSQTHPQDQSGRSRGPVMVTAQNVSHWFQNRRRKDNHPEIEEKRVKKRSARMKRQSAPLDLTQQATPPRSEGSPTPVVLNQDQGYHGNRRDSDDEAGPLFIDVKHESDADHEDEELTVN